jgi:hypothetical protein
LARDRRGTGKGWPCSGEGDHRRRGLRGGGDSGTHDGSGAPCVEGCDGRKSGSRREPEVAAERSPSTARLRRSMSTGDLRTSFSELWGRCRCNQSEVYGSDEGQPAKTVAAAAGMDAGERREGDARH